MRRMPIVSLFATLVLCSFHLAEAQKPPAVRKIGFLGSAASGLILSYEVFRQSLRELGYARVTTLLLSTGRPKVDQAA
jgi:hypothetical protein